MNGSSRVAVRGVGVIAPGAIGIDALRSLLAAGCGAIAPVDRFDTSDLQSHRAGLVRDFNPRDFIAPMKLRRMNALSRMAVAAARLAFDDAAIDRAPDAIFPFGVAIGSAFGPVSTSVDYLLEYVEKGPALAPPQLFAESVANAPGSHVAIEHRLTGFNVTFTQRNASAAHSIAFAALQLLKGVAGAAVAGGVDELHEITFSVLDRIGALARAGDGREERMRPLDRDRDGLVLGEGAAMFVLGAPDGSRSPWGFVSAAAFARDSTAPLSDWGDDDESVARAMRAALDDAGITADDVSAVWASANGSVRGDRVEARALRRLWGERSMPPVVATKGYCGEYAGAGALHVASALVALREQVIPISLGYTGGEEGLSLPVSTERRTTRLDHILLNAVSEGGGIVSLVLSREDR